MRGIRNNNPGNIRVGDQWQGLATREEMTPEQRTEKAFCVFRSPVYGIRAMAKLLLNYQTKFGLKTIAAMIDRWAPPEDNNHTAIYAKRVADAVGIPVGQVFVFANPALALPMMKAMIQVENGQQPYSDATILAGLHLAGIGDAPAPEPSTDPADRLRAYAAGIIEVANGMK